MQETGRFIYFGDFESVRSNRTVLPCQHDHFGITSFIPRMVPRQADQHFHYERYDLVDLITPKYVVGSDTARIN